VCRSNDRSRFGEPDGLVYRLRVFQVFHVVQLAHLVERLLAREQRPAAARAHAENLLVFLGHRIERPEPVQEPAEVGHAIGIAARRGLRRAEHAAALRARRAVGNEGDEAKYQSCVHSDSSLASSWRSVASARRAA